ncbi:MAG: 2OG-Fe(II) oxygenase [Xanthomonadales bacterium]|nr:2OG-Fe(II) oxygenase [Xanthomonadales bacterium]
MLAPRNDVDELAAVFAREGRVLVRDILAPDFAHAVLSTAQAWTEWNLVTRIGGEHRAFDARAMMELPSGRWTEFLQLVHAEARGGFQYLYERYPIEDRARAGQLSDPVLVDALALVQGEAFLALLRQITADPTIGQADLQLSRYRAGHFLSLHDDSDQGSLRRAAFVFNLSPAWSPDYGGLLQFVAGDGQVARAITPAFNTLSLFRVPTLHSVSSVAPYVDRARLALTGWARLSADSWANERVA